MNYKIIEENSTRLSIKISNHKELVTSITFTVIGILIPILSLLGITENILVSFVKIPKNKDSLYSLLIFVYMASIYALAQGLYGLTSLIDSTFSFDKVGQKVTLRVRKFFGSVSKDIALNEVTGVEELSKQNISEFVIWLGNTERVRRKYIVLGRVSGNVHFHILRRKISDFLKDQPIQLLDKEWTIRQSEDMLAVYNMYQDSDRRFYSVKKREKILIYEPDGKEQSRHDTTKILDIQVEQNPDKSDELSDRIILVMKSGEKEPISNYQYSFTAGHDIVVRALRYSLGLQSWLHFSPDM